jgi:hypothetical protein
VNRWLGSVVMPYIVRVILLRVLLVL